MEDKLKEPLENYCEKCSVAHALEIIGGKWKIPVIWILFNEKSVRYNELKRRIPGITNIMLTRTLKSLEEYNLVKRIEHNIIPPHVEYSLTDICKELQPALAIINEWGKKMP